MGETYSQRFSAASATFCHNPYGSCCVLSEAVISEPSVWNPYASLTFGFHGNALGESKNIRFYPVQCAAEAFRPAREREQLHRAKYHDLKEQRSRFAAEALPQDAENWMLSGTPGANYQREPAFDLFRRVMLELSGICMYRNETRAKKGHFHSFFVSKADAAKLESWKGKILFEPAGMWVAMNDEGVAELKQHYESEAFPKGDRKIKDVPDRLANIEKMRNQRSA